jgi:hypothetical protein
MTAPRGVDSSVSIMLRRSPRLHPNAISTSQPSFFPPGTVPSEPPSAGLAASNRRRSRPVPNTNPSHDLLSSGTGSSTANTSIPYVNEITLEIVFTNDIDFSIKIKITNKQCVITEEYTNTTNEKFIQVAHIPLRNLGTYLYTYLCAACLDDHLASWKSIQFLCSYIPTIYVLREHLSEKRELIIQTLLSHIQNLQGGL